MLKGLKTHTRLALAGALCLGALSGAAGACTLVESKFGLRAEGDCFAFAERFELRKPNLIVSKVEAHPNYAMVTTEMEVANTGPVGSEGLISYIVRGADGEYYPLGGTFDVVLQVQARDTSGQIVQIYDEYSGQWGNVVEYRARADRLGPGGSRSFFVGPFYLPDRDRNYDICISAVADPTSSSLPGGEIWESNESDNTRIGGERLFPYGAEPDYETPLCQS